MAFKIVKINGQPNSPAQKSYLLSELSDLEKLPRFGISGTQNLSDDTIADTPCAFGSTAKICTGNITKKYILTPDNKWTMVEEKKILSGNVSSDGNVFGLPQGGKTGQVLSKASDKDYDTKWINISENTNIDNYTIIQGIL